MMVTATSGVPERTWMRVVQSINERARLGWELTSFTTTTGARYLIKLQRVYTPGHDWQLHIRPCLPPTATMGNNDEYLLPSENNCWEITVCDDLRHGRLVTVHCYHPAAFNVMLSALERDSAYFASIRTHEPTQNARRELEERFACEVINQIFGDMHFS